VESASTIDSPVPANPDRERPILRGWSHVAGTIAALVLAPILIVATQSGTPRLVTAVYAFGVVALFGVSGFYHRVAWPTRFAAFFRRLDHSMIFVFIAATYTPIAAFVLEGRASTFILWFVWSGGLVGALVRMIWIDAPRVVVVLPYIAVGWCVLFVIDDVWRRIGVAGFVLLAAGGVLYTIGGAVYAKKLPNPSPKWFGYHEVFHLLVVAAVAVHYVAVAFYAVPQA